MGLGEYILGFGIGRVAILRLGLGEYMLSLGFGDSAVLKIRREAASEEEGRASVSGISELK